MDLIVGFVGRAWLLTGNGVESMDSTALTTLTAWGAWGALGEERGHGASPRFDIRTHVLEIRYGERMQEARIGQVSQMSDVQGRHHS